MSPHTTIAALATAAAPAGVAIVRVSGPRAREALRLHFRCAQDPTKKPRCLFLGEILETASGAVIDQGLAVFMPGPRSYTGEDVAEFHLHGSPFLAKRLLRSLFSFGVDPAQAGEFTKRAFLNGKLDLVQAEAVCDLIEASGERAEALAREQLRGGLSRETADIGEALRALLAEIEAALDFPEEDLPLGDTGALQVACTNAYERISTLLSTYRCGRTLREGLRVLLWGRPNTGKSSLLNRLLGSERAIVTEVSGTTRDLIEESAEIEGCHFIFCDTAGITDSTDKGEQIAVERAKEKIAWADLVLCLADAEDHNEAWQKPLSMVIGKAAPVWVVTNKIDLNPHAKGRMYPGAARHDFYISAKLDWGIDKLKEALLQDILQGRGDLAHSNLMITHERHHACLAKSQAALQRALHALKNQLPLEICALELRSALGALDELIGATTNEEILNRIFSRFCIGK